MPEFSKKVLGQEGSAIYRSIELTDEDEILTAGVLFILIKAFRNT